MRKLKITELNRISIEEFKEADKLPLVVLLDNVRSLHNVGSVFRTADAFRVECIYLCGITATPPHDAWPLGDYTCCDSLFQYRRSQIRLRCGRNTVRDSS